MTHTADNTAAASTPALLPGILFVEDSEDDFFIAQCSLKRVNVCSPVACVDSIHDMFVYLEKRGLPKDSAAPLPCVIIMDLSLRGEGGLTGIAKLRSSLKYRDIPIIATSGDDQL